MPKGKKKGKYEHKRTEQGYSSDEDAGIDMTIDNMSETSGQSDLRSIHDEADAEIQEKFEEKVMETIDGLGARANAARAAAFVSLRAALQRRYLAPLLANHRATLADHLTKAIRRGKDGERKAAASLAPLLALQIGEEGTEEFMKEVRPALAACAVDKTASIETRTECCLSLSVVCYLLEEDLTEILEVMRMYETIFSGSYLKGDGSVKVSGQAVEQGALHAAALDGWALLLSLPPAEHAAALLRSSPPGLPRLADLLTAASLEVRMAAGGALAIAYECVLDTEAGDSAAEHVASLLPRLDELARDSHKFRAKKERKLQRATFRDILKYFEEETVPALAVRVGAERVQCGTWWARAAYGALAATLGAGLQALAPHSAALRRALGLPDAVATPLPKQKLNKLHRHLANNAADKARTVARGKNRDKRSAALAM
ncbi:interferon-related developmental regulator 2 isoform X2 [Cydia pomonella]|uniref:interferon-related developmental regulator 2 isoform X2 n=1 Tax=Cydia pomonella TaxID=82600 RepID=UPI002ADDB374|nr:interferon-related developmental regulator 2 isoform X2 [Cydia pomonella]